MSCCTHLTLLFLLSLSSCFFFFNDTATTEIYTLSLHDALPISSTPLPKIRPASSLPRNRTRRFCATSAGLRSEEHTSELQSRPHLVCRLLLEKKKSHLHVALCPLAIVHRRLCLHLTTPLIVSSS